MQSETRVQNVNHRNTGIVKSQCQCRDYVLVRYDGEFKLVAEPVRCLRAM